MDRVFSARVDESIVHRVAALARRLHTSRKRIIEEAVGMYEGSLRGREKMDVLTETFGAWKRKESPDELVTRARQAFRGSMTRRQK